MHVDEKIWIDSKCRDPEKFERDAELDKEVIADVIGEADFVFLSADLGDCTSSLASPVIARVARKSGATVIALAIIPFAAESERVKVADDGLKKLLAAADTVLVLSRDCMAKAVPAEQVSGALNQIIAETINCISEDLNGVIEICIGEADIRAVFGNGGAGTLLFAEASGENKAENLRKNMLSLGNIDYKSAETCLFHLIVDPRMSRTEAYGLLDEMDKIVDSENEVANFILKKEYVDKVQGIIIVTHLNKEGRREKMSAAQRLEKILEIIR